MSGPLARKLNELLARLRKSGLFATAGRPLGPGQPGPLASLDRAGCQLCGVRLLDHSA